MNLSATTMRDLCNARYGFMPEVRALEVWDDGQTEVKRMLIMVFGQPFAVSFTVAEFARLAANYAAVEEFITKPFQALQRLYEAGAEKGRERMRKEEVSILREELDAANGPYSVRQRKKRVEQWKAAVKAMGEAQI